MNPIISIAPTDKGIRIIVDDKVYEKEYTASMLMTMGCRLIEAAHDRYQSLEARHKNKPSKLDNLRRPTTQWLGP